MWLKLAFLAFFSGSFINAFASLPDKQLESKIDAIVMKYLSNPENAGLSIGIIKEGKEITYCYGQKNKLTGQKIDSNSIFEIGSITKLFTSLIFAEEIRKGEIRAEDKLCDCFPAGVISEACSQINLLQLSTHSSGLPRLADNFWSSVYDHNNPYISYSDKKLYSYLSSAKPAFLTGSHYNYSNVGAGILGFILSIKKEISYESLVNEYVCTPFDMNNTCIRLNNDQLLNLASGHSKGNVVKNWDFQDATAGQGALRSNITDMIKFMRYNLYPEQSVLSDAIIYAQKIHFKDYMTGMQTGLGWHIGRFNNEKYLEHTGGTGGYRSFIGICPQSKMGVIVLSNSDNGVAELGIEILKELNKISL